MTGGRAVLPRFTGGHGRRWGRGAACGLQGPIAATSASCRDVSRNQNRNRNRGTHNQQAPRSYFERGACGNLTSRGQAGQSSFTSRSDLGPSMVTRKGEVSLVPYFLITSLKGAGGAKPGRDAALSSSGVRG
jgi:hypothetical protein